MEASRKLVALSHKRKHNQQSLLNFADPQDHNANRKELLVSNFKFIQ